MMRRIRRGLHTGETPEETRRNEREMEEVKRRLARVEAQVRALQATARRRENEQ